MGYQAIIIEVKEPSRHVLQILEIVTSSREMQVSGSESLWMTFEQTCLTTRPTHWQYSPSAPLNP